MRYKIRYVDPSRNKDIQPNFVLINVDDDKTSLLLMFHKACEEGKFPSGLVERGLDVQVPVVIYSTDGDGKNTEQTSLSFEDMDCTLQKIFKLFTLVNVVKFHLKKQECLTSNSSSSSKNAGVFSIFLTPEGRLQEASDSSKRRKQEDTKTPMTRDEFKSKIKSNIVMPNMDLAYDQVLTWLLCNFDFKCSQRVRDNTDHLIYRFIEDMSLLILQVKLYVVTSLEVCMVNKRV